MHPRALHIVDNEALTRQEAADTPGSATVIDRSQWTAQRASTIKEVTDFVPGVYAQPRNGAESQRLAIRGSGLANTFQGRGLLVLQDGVPINMADGEFEFPVIDPFLIDRAVILPGANALSEGASTLGGAINFITPNGYSGEGLGVRGEVGSFGTAHGLVSAGANKDGSDVFAAASTFHQGGFRDHNQQNAQRLNATAGWRPAPNLESRLTVSHTISRPQIPGAISRADIAENPKRANGRNIAGDYRRDVDITRLSNRTAWQDGRDRLETTLYYTYRTLDNPVTTYIREDNNDVGARLRFTRDTGTDKWITGLNVAYGAQDESRTANIGGDEGDSILDRNLYALTSEAYGQYEHALADRLYGIASMQVAYSTRDITEKTPVRDEQDRSFTGYNPRVGLRYDLDPQSQLFANVSRSFEPPTWAELSGGNDPGFNDLDAQTATTAEIGGRGRIMDIDLSAAIFNSWLSNEFVNYEFADGTSDTINADRSIHRGIELGLSGEPLRDLAVAGDGVQFRTAYTYSRFRLDDDPLYGDNRLPGMPDHYFRGELLYRHTSGVAIGPNIEWASSYPIDLTNSLSADDYRIFGARLLWRSADGQGDVFIEGRNLTDRHYVATTNIVPDANGTDGNFFYPGEGRSIFAGLRWRL